MGQLVRCRLSSPPINNSTIHQFINSSGLAADKGTKDSLLRGVLELHLRMPLDADAPGVFDVLDGFDDAVLGPGDGAQAVADAIDGLVMPRAHLRFGAAEAAGGAAVGGGSGGVDAGVG